MSAIDELRRMLDECDITIYDYGTEVWWGGESSGGGGAKYTAYEQTDGLICVEIADLTPEKAVAATLGAGTCSNASKVMDEHGQARFACSECGAWIDSRMLWNPEYRNGESPWVSDCKLNYCPNCGRRIEDTDG